MRFIVASALALSLLSAAGERAGFSQDASPKPTLATTNPPTPPPIGTTDSQITTTKLTALDTPTTVSGPTRDAMSITIKWSLSLLEKPVLDSDCPRCQQC
jgi:hypothetical protein